MKNHISAILISTLLALPAMAAENVVSRTVGQVKDHVLTSREVMQNMYVEAALFGGPEPPQFNGDDYLKRVNGILLEWVVFLEAESFNTSTVKKSVIQSSYKKVVDRWGKSTGWRSLESGQAEVYQVIRRKLRAKDFIRFKANSSLVPITDIEAEEYYTANQKKFGTLPFAQLRENIKSFLKKKQLDERLKAWFEVLQSKYQVRNHLI